MSKWVSAFHISHAKFFEYNKVTNRTIRIVIPNNISGNGIRILLSNKYGNSPALIGGITVARSDSKGNLLEKAQKVTIGGEEKISIEVGVNVYTDEIPFYTDVGCYYSVSIYFPEQDPIKSGGNVGKYGIRSIPGEFLEAEYFEADSKYNTYYNGVEFEVDTPIPLFKSLDVLTDQDVMGLTFFGDSITAGCHFTKPLTERIYAEYPGKIACGNSGVSGNCLMTDTPEMYDKAFGDSGISRFEEDVLERSGITHCVVSIGCNDLGYPGMVQMNTPVPTAETMLEYYRKIVAKARKKNIRIGYIALFPRGDVMNSPEKETVRRELNLAVKEAGLFDFYQSFETELSKDGEAGVNEDYVLADKLHLNSAGGNIVADHMNVAGIIGK